MGRKISILMGIYNCASTLRDAYPWSPTETASCIQLPYIRRTVLKGCRKIKKVLHILMGKG